MEQEDRYAITIAMGFFWALIAFVAVLLRFMARRVRKLSPQADDWVIIAAYIGLLGQCLCNIVGAFAGRVGTHDSLDTTTSPDIHAQRYVIRAKVIWVTQLFGSLAPGLTRMSILLFYQRIFLGTAFKITTWTIFSLNAIWTISFFFANLLGCVPISGNWILGPPPDTCVHFDMLFKSMVVSDVILDGLVLTIPWYPVWQLQMPKRQKFTVCGIFLLGGFVCVAGIFRVVAMYDALHLTMDSSYDHANAFYWATIETGAGIVSACLPTLRPLMSKSGPESMIRSVQRRIRGSLSRSKLRDDGSSHTRPSGGSDVIPGSFSSGSNEKPRVFDGVPKSTYQHTSAETTGDLERAAPPAEGILVESKVSHT